MRMHGFHQRIHTFLSRHITGKSDHLAAGPQRVQLLCDRFAGIALAAGDQHRSARTYQRLGSHTANTCGTASHQRHFAFQPE